MNKLSKMLLAMSVILALHVNAIAQKPSPELLSPTNHALVMIDFQGQMAFATSSIDITNLRTNTALISGGSKIFKIPTVITAVNSKTFSGPYFAEIQEVYPQTTIPYIERTTMNSWEDANAYKAIVGKNKKKIVLAGLWTSVCIVGPALSAIADGYEVYVISDACGDVSKEAHEMAMQRMIKAGVHPMTSIQYVLELQRDWSRSETYGPVTELIKKYGGAYGLGIQYAHDMLKH